MGLALVAAIVLAVASPAAGYAQARYPEPVGFVNDFAGVLSPGAVQALEGELRRLQEGTTAEVVVVTVATLGDQTDAEYAVGLFQQWGVGQKGKDNGILLLVAIQERRIRIEVGYGLEPVVTDGRAGRIIRDAIAPALKGGDYDQGITLGATSLAALVRSGQSPAPLEDNPVRDRFSRYGWLLWPLGFLTIYVMSYAARTRELVLGALWGAGLGAFLGLLLGGLLALGLSVIGLAAAGLFMDWVLSANYKGLRSSGKGTGFARSWGGWRGTPGPRGGSGGFGGFGGGRSGGGGASGGF